MSYVATIPLEFDCSRHRVYEALCDLSRYPRWNSGMTYVSYKGRMHIGLQYLTHTKVLGRLNKAKVTVVDLVPDELIALENDSGLITFRAVFQLTERTPDSCALICNLRFQFSTLVFNLAQPVAEAVAESRISGDLETLRTML